MAFTFYAALYCYVGLTLTLSALSSPLSTSKQQPPSALSCPLYLAANNFEFPHLIVPISQFAPDASLGNTFTPAVSPNDFATIFNFDIPTSRANQTCSLYFAVPNATQLFTTSFTYWGKGTFQFTQYKQNYGANAKTTWNTQPTLSGSPVGDGVINVVIPKVAPGNAYKIWAGDCGQGGIWSWRMSSVDSCLWYFQDFNPCVIGLYLVYG